jgi:arabinofuranosyltransferase
MKIMPQKISLNSTQIFICFIGLGLLVFNLVNLYSVADDAYISFRYLDNWLDGLGLVYNPGERVEGYTNFLWIILLAPLRLLGLEPESASLFLSLAALALTLWAVFRTASMLAGSPGAGAAALLLAASSAPLAQWTTSGMETTCFAAMLALANLLLVVHRRHSLGSSLFFALAVLTRPPGALFAAVAFAAALPWRGPQRLQALRGLAGPFLFFTAILLAQLAFRLAYYGRPLPNTFYAKLSGDLPSLVPLGLIYLKGFLVSGGIVLMGSSLLGLLGRRFSNWIMPALVGQVISHLAYVVWVGGDYFPFHRFVVPVIPILAVLAGVGLEAASRRFAPGDKRVLSAGALMLAMAQFGLSYGSLERRALRQVVTVRHEREMVGDWLASHLPADTLIAVNAAGFIPYRTGMPTVDMLGLNDRHIAGAPVGRSGNSQTFVGHFKHDGNYVCGRKPDVVLTSGARLHPGRSAEEAMMQAALNTFPGDREFLLAPGCRDRYRPFAEQLAPGRYLVVYRRQQAPVAEQPLSVLPTTAKGWFQYGITLMRRAKLEEAIKAFKQSLALNPGHPATLTNMGFALLDLQRYQAATDAFEKSLKQNPHNYDAVYGLALSHQKLGHRNQAISLWRQYIADAPDSPWKDRAREQLGLLSNTRP